VDAVELLRARNRFDVTLPSGLNVTIRLPRLRDCILAGDVPLPVLERMSKLSNGDGKKTKPEERLSPEETRHVARFQDEVVRATLVAIEGQEVEMTLEAVNELEQDDYDALAGYGTRAVVIPKAGAST
jgi:hypothetical protein